MSTPWGDTPQGMRSLPGAKIPARQQLAQFVAVAGLEFAEDAVHMRLDGGGWNAQPGGGPARGGGEGYPRGGGTARTAPPARGGALPGVQRGLNQVGSHFLRGALLLLCQGLQRMLQLQVESEGAAGSRGLGRRRGRRQRQAEESGEAVPEVHASIL